VLPSSSPQSSTPVEDRGGRLRMLKYTPEHMHCIATFYGPITPPGTGILGYQVYIYTHAISQHTTNKMRQIIATHLPKANHSLRQKIIKSQPSFDLLKFYQDSFVVNNKISESSASH
jgi:hypothetical protein